MWTSFGVNFKPGTREGLAKVGPVSVVQESVSLGLHLQLQHNYRVALVPGIPYPCGTLSEAVLVTLRWILSLEQCELMWDVSLGDYSYPG